MLTDAYAPDWLDSLDSIATERDASANSYLLLDGAFIPGIHKRISASLLKNGHLSFLFQNLPGWRDAVRDVSPVIFQYDGTNLRLRQILNECSGWPMLSAIVTPEPLEDLARRLSRWCVVQAAGQHINLRFPDTRRLHDVYGVMTDEQRAAMFGPAELCAYIGRDGKWAAIALSGTAPSSNEEPALTDSQFDELLRCGEADSMLAQLEDRSTPKTGASRSAQYETVCAAITLGKAQQLDRRDLMGWCQFSLESAASEQAPPELFAEWHSEQTTNQVG